MNLKSLLLALAVPPINLALLATLGLVLHLAAPRGRAGIVLIALGLAGLLLLSLPVVADSLTAALDADRRGTAEAPAAIVVLSAETERDGAPPHVTIPGPLTLERLRAGAALARRTRLPLLVTGGQVEPLADPAAVAMQHSLADDFSQAPRWVEPASATTWQNAVDSAAILRPLGIHSIYLVTHAWHMRRALIAFQAAGFDATTVPVRHDPWPLWYFRDFVPQVGAWHRSYYALHEWSGCLIYAVRAWLARR